jgi:hypothetical protein
MSEADVTVQDDRDNIEQFSDAELSAILRGRMKEKQKTTANGSKTLN